MENIEKSLYEPTEGEKFAIDLCRNEVSDWEEGQVWITDKVSFNMKNVVKKARKNYFGIFDKQNNPVTGRPKIFVPFTESTIENVTKSIDIDTKDIDAIARKQDSYATARIFRYVLKFFLDKINFGKKLNDMLKNLAIDGTAIFKVWKGEGKLHLRLIDRLNIIVDPSAETIDDSSAVIERNLLTLPEFQSYTEWKNTELVEGTDTIDRTSFDNSASATIRTQVPYVEVFERYGYFPKFVLTSQVKDRNEYLYGLIVVSDINGTPIIHKVKEVKQHPYQEFQFKKCLNRFDGRGIAEMLFSIQAYLNEIVNVRLDTARIVQTGLWKIKGQITPQQLSRLFSTHAIKTDGGDIERLDTGTIDQSSYKDEEQAYLWGQRVTGTTVADEVTTNRPATNALIQERDVTKGYNLVMEGIMLNLKKMLEEKVVPIIKDILKEEDVITLTGDPQDMERLEEPFIKNYVNQKLKEFKDTNGYPATSSPEGIQMVMEQVKKERAKLGKNRWVEIKKSLFDTEFDINITIGDEQINKALMAQTLNQTIGILAKVGMPIKNPLRELFDIMGLDADKLIEDTPMPPPTAGQGQAPMAGQGARSEVAASPTEGAIMNPVI